ncbi:Fanconi-associated nuclease 1, partial [Coemansia aciculifera]
MQGKRKRSGSARIARITRSSAHYKRQCDEAIVLSDDESSSDVAEISSAFAISASLPLPATNPVVIVLGDSEVESPAIVSRARKLRPITPSRSAPGPSPGLAVTEPSLLSNNGGSRSGAIVPVQRRSSILTLVPSAGVVASGICSPPPSPKQVPAIVLVDDDGGGCIPVSYPVVASPKVADLEPAIPDADEKQATERLSYLYIFDNVLQTVLGGESHLFSDQEQETLRAFAALERHSRYLYTRLFMRKHGWIRVSALKNYGLDVVVEQSCKCLGMRTSSHEPFVQSEAEISDGEEALQVLTLPELKGLAKARGIKQLTGKPKEAICAAILKSTKQRTVVSFFRKAAGGNSGNIDPVKERLDTLIREVAKLTGPLVRLCPRSVELFERLHLVFFRAPTFRGDDNPMKVAVLATIGQIRFPKYSVDRSCDLFTSREDVIQYKALLDVGSKMNELGSVSVKETDSHKQGWEMFLAHRDMWMQHIESLRDKAGVQSR